MKLISSLLFLLFCWTIAAGEFPIGVYSPEPKDDATMEAIRKAGFNLVNSYIRSDAEYSKLLELAQKHHLKVMFNLDRRLIEAPDGLEKMRTIVRRYKDHSALGYWYLYDEPAKKITPEVLRPFYQMLKIETPHIPVALVNCWDETWDQYGDVLDLQMVDTYPVRDEKFPNAPLQYFTTFVNQAVKLGKPVIPVQQLVSWRSFGELLKGQGYNHEAFRYPNQAELRYMVFGSLTSGISGMFGYSYYHSTRTGGDPSWWEKVCTPVFCELKKFVEQLKDPSKPRIFTRANDGNYQAALWTGNEGDQYLVMVNAWPLHRSLAGFWTESYFKQDYELQPWGTTRSVPASICKNRLKITGEVEPWEVFIWKLQPVRENHL